MKIKADLHNHLSTLKEDLKYMAPKAMEIASKRLGKNGIIGIINAQDLGEGRYETFIKGLKGEDLENAFYHSETNLYVIKGQEVFTKGGHILVLGLDKGVKLKDRRTLEDSFKEARDNRGIIILDHPLFMDGVITKNPEKIKNYLGAELIDGIEVYNGQSWLPIPGYFNSNSKAQKFYNQIKEKYNLGGIYSSDGHSIYEIGSSYTLLEQPDFSTPDKLRESLRKSIKNHRDFFQDKKSMSIFSTLNHAIKILILRLLSKAGLFREIN
ncbi:MAG: hypothetical protein KKG94_00965 [Nanoarchaeota archaeon]|nr:hypothetical protein [Nanoarchaeota archaeon]